MPVAVIALTVNEEALRHDDIEMVARPRHGDVKEPPFLFDLRARSGRQIGWHAAVDGIQDMDRLPLLPFRRMDGGEDEIILIEQWRPGAVAGRLGRIERELGEEALPARIGCGDLHELMQIRLPQAGVLVDAIEMRLIPAAREIEFGGPSRCAGTEQTDRFDE